MLCQIIIYPARSAALWRRQIHKERWETMKFIHIADVHLGAQPDAGPLYSKGRAQEICDTFEKVIHVCE